jgi:outer membrane protein assembly factor BamB
VAAVGDGGVRWRARVTSARLAQLAVTADGTLVAAAADGAVAGVSRDGRLLWRGEAGGPISRSPALGDDGTVYLAAGEHVVALSARGAPRWRTRARGPIVAGPLIADDGTVYVAVAPPSRPPAVIALRPDGAVDRVEPLPAEPMRGLALQAGNLWIGLADLTLRRIDVPQRGLAQSAWPKARGDRENTGARR